MPANGHKVIEIRSLTFCYPDGTKALDNVSLEVHAGEKVAILGENGAGKSSLLLHLNGVLRSNGHVRIFGMPVERKHLQAIRQKVGLVFQNPDDQLFCPSIYDDIAFGPRNLQLGEDEIGRRVSRSLEAVGLKDVSNKSAFHLSFGQKKRAAIATVLSMDTELLVLDEPTSNLDPKARRELLELLQQIGGTQIIATHDLDFAARLCTRVVILSSGRKVADGPPSAILDDRGLLEKHGLN